LGQKWEKYGTKVGKISNNFKYDNNMACDNELIYLYRNESNSYALKILEQKYLKMFQSSIRKFVDKSFCALPYEHDDFNNLIELTFTRIINKYDVNQRKKRFPAYSYFSIKNEVITLCKKEMSNGNKILNFASTDG
jgi:DNA-directed RNA polymerase specialized sigma subunit